MKTRELTVPDVAMIAATRVMLGVGVGLLLSDRLDREQRRAVGCTLLLVGAATTLPLLAKVFGTRKPDRALLTHA